MSDPRNTPTPPPVELSDADQRALDALLTEALHPRARERDFSASILARMQQKPVRRPCNEVQLPPGQRAGSNWVVAAAVVALAASVLVMVFTRGPWNQALQVAQPRADSGTSATPDPGAFAGSDPAGQSTAGSPPGAGASPETEAAVAASRPPRKPPVVLSEGLPQADPGADEGLPQVDPPTASVATETAPRSPAAEGNQLADFNRQFAAYWKAIGVTPAPPVDQSTWLARVADRFGWQPDAAAEHPSVEEAFTDSEACRALAERLVDQLVAGLKPTPERREQLIQEATEVIASGGRFDRWLSGWATDDAWLSASDAVAEDPAVVGEWLASRVIGVDVGCAKCHDSPIDSRYVQHDFWAMAALFSPPEDGPLFYELEDGRQRVATPGIPSRWFGSVAQNERSAELASREELAGLMLGSPQIARTLANHLWAIGFGMPLVAATSSPMAPPRDEALDRALVMLGDRLQSENFDIRAAARWVIDCDPMKRGVPEDLAEERWQIADESKLAEASLAQRAFAADRIALPQPSRSQLLAMMQSRGGLIPATLAAPDSLLAQPRPSSPQPLGNADGSRRSPQGASSPATGSPIKEVDLDDYWWTQWLADREGLRHGWLESIGDADQQLQHAFYAAGYRHIDPEQLQRVKALLAATQKSKQDRSETIAQIHWILQNSK